MPGPALKEMVEEADARAAELGTGIVDELADIIAMVEDNIAGDEPELAHWFYRIPCPGIRYYSYRE